MKHIMAGLLIGVAVLSTHPVSGQTNLNFNKVIVTGESAVQLHWNSTSNEVYRIEYANELNDPTYGTTLWQPLYDYYPSHGTNTFWLDTGNRIIGGTNVSHPKDSPMRFYRIVNRGENDGEAPYIRITAPTNNSVLSGLVTVSVVATSSMPVLSVRLFVDGEELAPSEDGTNFVINTCEWLNGSHVLFATAKSQSSLSGPRSITSIAIGRNVSPYVNVTFSNLIYGVAFSERFFEPSLGQTQNVSAKFAANVDWTLDIVNDSSNVVRTVTGSGTSLNFAWDGNGQGGTNIPNGVYYYNISAETNGMSSLIMESEESLFSSILTTEEGDFIPTNAKQALALGVDSYFVKLPPLPPVKVNGVWVHDEEERFQEINVPLSASTLGNASLMSFGGSGSQAAAVSSPQSTQAPDRSTAPVRGTVDNYCIGYYTYDTPIAHALPRQLTTPVSPVVHLEGDQSNGTLTFDILPESHTHAITMINKMDKLGWKLEEERHDDILFVNAMRRGDQGGGEFFTKATIGFFLAHGTYGTDMDLNPGSSGSKQVYFPSGNASDGTGNTSWLRLCQFGFGGNLKWMALMACNSLCDPNFQDMVNKGAIPLKTTHLVCGIASVGWITENIGAYWAENMIKKKQPIREAWFDAAIKQYHEPLSRPITNTVIFRVAGYPECIDDTIATNTPPSSPSSSPSSLIKRDRQVFP